MAGQEKSRSPVKRKGVSCVILQNKINKSKPLLSKFCSFYSKDYNFSTLKTTAVHHRGKVQPSLRRQRDLGCGAPHRPPAIFAPTQRWGQLPAACTRTRSHQTSPESILNQPCSFPQHSTTPTLPRCPNRRGCLRLLQLFRLSSSWIYLCKGVLIPNFLVEQQ